MTTPEPPQKRLSKLGENHFLTTPVVPNEGIPMPEWVYQSAGILTPSNSVETASMVTAAQQGNIALLPTGGKTQLMTGYPIENERVFYNLSLEKMNRVLDYQPDDMTVTCEPGIPLAALQSTLLERRQFLALEVPLPEQATLGGIVSTNVAGFTQPTYGTPRDLLIGLHAIISGGIEVKGGGKVVKNVAGYDVCKLFTGAWGTLGVLTELTFKVRPLPEIQRVVAWAMPDCATASRLGFEIHQAQLAPLYLLATNELNGTPYLVASLAGTPKRVEWQIDEIDRRLHSAGVSTERMTISQKEANALRDTQARLDSTYLIALRISALPSEQASILQQVQNIPGLRLTASCMNGIINITLLNDQEDGFQQLCKAIPHHANVVWQKLPRNFVESLQIAIWVEKRPDFRIHKAIKQSLDPQRTFSPGRFVGQL